MILKMDAAVGHGPLIVWREGNKEYKVCLLSGRLLYQDT